MTKFNPTNKEILTLREIFEPAMSITEQEDANQYLADYIAYTQKWLDKEPRQDNMTAEDIAKHNFGYYAGYYGEDARRRVEKLFNCEHPIFGSIEKNGSPSFTQAFEAGKNMANSKK